MLVLSRRKDETIMIGDEVEITIVDVRGDTVRLGIKAPRSVSVHRKEIYDAIQAENIAAAQESVPDQSAVGGLGSLLKGDVVRPSALGRLSGAGAAAPSAGPVAKPAGLDKLMGMAKNKAAPAPEAPAPSPFKLSGLDKLISRVAKTAAPPAEPSAPAEPPAPKPDTVVKKSPNSRSTKVTRPRKPRSPE